MNKKRKIKKEFKVVLVIISVLLLFLVIYNIGMGRVDKNASSIDFEVGKGSTYSTIASSLKEEKLIRSEFFYKVYIKLYKPQPLQAGTYELSGNMSVKELVHELESNTKHESKKVTFKEGINFRDITKLITDNFGYTEEEVLAVIEDETYLDELINTYWFLTPDIKNKNIYYSLEGYLFPDTYQFNKNSSIKDIFKVMFDNTDKKLSKYKKDIEKSKHSIHEIMTMASIIELEASNSNDRAGVAGVFYNRLVSGWSLGSDVTTYYGIKVSLSERDLTQAELNTYNNYNTRSSKMAGKLPISPICIPGIESIKAALYPENHDYYYFVADKTGKTYFSKTSNEHTKTVAKLKKEGLWFTY